MGTNEDHARPDTFGAGMTTLGISLPKEHAPTYFPLRFPQTL